MKIKFTKEQAEFIRGHGSTFFINGEYWHYQPFWYRSTDKEDVFEQVLFENLPDYLKDAVKRFRDGDEVNK